ncbi:hypothetical protein MtrunA17_Chr3g0083231 [Medicago truncatula]|uniref:Transmembrane protein n=1 Tax=Medicago truncatula TaxID=3880 RepID=A0A396IKG7_MEDTR|nr:hypothetical protein MtrunA17_Chr3g0083231 [Medicago truncatula]
MEWVEINTDASNGHNSLEPKPLELGLAQFVSNVIHIRNKYDVLQILGCLFLCFFMECLYQILCVLKDKFKIQEFL